MDQNGIENINIYVLSIVLRNFVLGVSTHMLL